MSKFTTGFILGATASTIYTLLYTKQSGKTARQNITNYAHSSATNVTNFKNDILHLQQTTTQLQKTVNDSMPILNDITHTIQKFIIYTKPNVVRLSRHIDTLKSHLQNKEESHV